MDGKPQGVKSAPFAADGDEDLLAYMAMKDDPSCRAAGGAFYERHRAFLYNVLRKQQYGRLVGGDEGLCDVVQVTFLSALVSAHTYGPCGSDDPGRQRRACRAWIVGIAQNLIRDALRRPKSVTADASLDEYIEFIADAGVDDEPESAAVRAMSDALAELSEREQDVLRTTMMFYKPGERHQRLPNNVARNLAKQFSTTPENIRAIRKRAFDKLRVRLEPWNPENREVRR